MLTIPNFLSFIRIPLALLFFQQNIFFRFLAIVLAMISDGLDGYLARRYRLSTTFGTLLDPVADKFFAFVALGVFLGEDKLNFFEAMTFISRDLAVFFFGIYLTITNQIGHYRVQAIWTGKLATSLQFGVMLSFTFHLAVPPYVYMIFLILGLGAFLELLFRKTEPLP